MVIAFSGTRRTLSAHQSAAIHSVTAALGPAVASGSVSLATGCSPTGADQTVAARARLISIPIRIFRATSPAPQHLRSRTLSLVKHASLLIALPASPSFARSGTWLSVFAAANRGIPVAVIMPYALPHIPSLPLVRGITYWQLATLPSLAPTLALPPVPVVVPSLPQLNLFAA